MLNMREAWASIPSTTESKTVQRQKSEVLGFWMQKSSGLASESCWCCSASQAPHSLGMVCQLSRWILCTSRAIEMLTAQEMRAKKHHLSPPSSLECLNSLSLLGASFILQYNNVQATGGTFLLLSHHSVPAHRGALSWTFCAGHWGLSCRTPL